MTKPTRGRGCAVDAHSAAIFAQAVRSHWPLSDEDLARFLGIARVSELDPGEYFLRIGERAHRACVVVRGVLRSFWILDNGTERTTTFAIEQELGGSLGDLLAERPSRTAVQAVTRTKLVEFPYAALESLQREHLAFSELSRRVAEALAIQKDTAIREMVSLDAEARYARFRERWPALEEHVTQTMVATYLGISPEHLSRIRRRSRPGSQHE